MTVFHGPTAAKIHPSRLPSGMNRLWLVCTGTCAIEICDRKDANEMVVRPLPRFAHSAVAVPSTLNGINSMVQSWLHISLVVCSSLC